MRLIVCGKSEDGKCLGMPGGFVGYVVFTVLAPVDVVPGDLLASPVWDEEDEVIPDVVRLKDGEKFPIRIEGVGLSLAIARRMVAGGVAWHPPWPGDLD